MASEGLDNELFLSLGDKSFSAGPERLASVLECMHELGLDAKQMQKRSSYSLTADPKRIKDSFRVLGSHEDLDAVKLLNNAPMLVWTAPDEIKSRIKNLQKKGLKPRMINANAKVLLVDNERINNRIAKYKNLGLNYEFIINSDMFALTSSDELIDARIDGLNAMGLDAIRCINACPSLLNTKTERVRSKLLIVRAILRYYGSEKPAEEIVHKFPAILVRSAEKLRSTVRMLAGSVDDKYMATEGVEELDKYMIIPTDTLFLAVAIHRTQEFSPGGLTASSIRIVRREVSAKETRGRILEILSDAGARRTVGARAVNTYLASSPLTGQERARYSWHEA